MDKKQLIIATMMVVALLTFFDFVSFRVQVGFLNITLLRVILLGICFFLIGQQIWNKEIIISHSAYINYVLLFFIVWILYGTLQITWAIDKRAAIKEVYYLSLFFILVYNILRLLNSKFMFTQINRFLYYVAIFFIVFAIVELHFNIHFPVSRVVAQPDLYNGVRRATATFYNENDFSFYLVLIAPMFLLNILYKKGIERLWNVLFVGAIFYIVIANDSKLCLIALLTQVIALWWLNQKAKVRKLSVAALFIFAIFFIIFKWSYLQHSYSLVKQQLYSGSGSTFIRKELIFHGIDFFKNSYFLGIGPGNFETNISIATAGKGINGIFNAHNWWIELLANYGLIIFSLYVTMFLLLLIQLHNIGKSNVTTYSYYGKLFLISFIGFVFASASSSNIFYTWYQWLHFALALAIINIYHTPSSPCSDV
ncbi:MAG: O-antigen ligase family protein [Anoxybacillus sp.]|nr:O-antigen ligase family protein [Anoxybacillus sp.]MCL6587111.1 O-antigen ligase family protein [Anoxybacillus sp.]